MKKKLLFITDLSYQAKGRIYYTEDLFLSEKLGRYFDLCLCHPKAAIPFLGDVDVILFRNTGPVLNFTEEYAQFKAEAERIGSKVFNQLSGKADMQGKKYLIELTQAGFPVIPSIDNINDLNILPMAHEYLVKPINGADSLGMETLAIDKINQTDLTGKLIQPIIDFIYEVSFYFINHEYQYALYAPDRNQRWKLEPYMATPEDLEFAYKFIKWNEIEYGIQRVDACRTKNGGLLLMELEDLNPYLSLDLLSSESLGRFVKNFSNALIKYSTC